jgi:PQQ-dependent catabolism-associated CXXCW motif protein
VIRVLAVAAALLAGGGADAAPPEPEGFRGEPYRGEVPATLRGATVIDTHEAERLWRERRAVFIDALPRTPRPEGLPEGTVWREPPHETIEGAIWLPNTGYQALSAEEEAYLEEGLASASAGELDRPLVVFCKAECWMSWNVAKRAVELGYERVHWFPQGIDGWQDAGLPTAIVEPF